MRIQANYYRLDYFVGLYTNTSMVGAVGLAHDFIR